MCSNSKQNYVAPGICIRVIQTSGILAASDRITKTYYGGSGDPGKINEVCDEGSF